MTEDPNLERETAALLGKLRAAPPPAARERAFAAVQREFDSMKATPRHDAVTRRAAPRWALAAGVGALAVASAWYGARPLPQVAQVETLDGSVAARGARWFDRATQLVEGARISAGESIDAPAHGSVLLRVSPDLTVRLDAGAKARFDAADELELTVGEVYVDATPGAHAPLRIVTPQGVVSHLGTQYLVSTDGEHVELAVREGRAQLAARGATAVAVAGHWLRLRKGDEKPQSGEIAADDARFEWIGKVPTAFELDGASLAAFLAWFQRETGLTPVYRGDIDAEHFAQVKLRGSIDNLEPLEALKFVLATADLSWHREGACIVIEKRQPSGI